MKKYYVFKQEEESVDCIGVGKEVFDLYIRDRFDGAVEWTSNEIEESLNLGDISADHPLVVELLDNNNNWVLCYPDQDNIIYTESKLKESDEIYVDFGVFESASKKSIKVYFREFKLLTKKEKSLIPNKLDEPTKSEVIRKISKSGNGDILLEDSFPVELLNDVDVVFEALCNTSSDEEMLKKIPLEIKNSEEFWRKLKHRYEGKFCFVYKFIPSTMKRILDFMDLAIQELPENIIYAPKLDDYDKRIVEILKRTIESGSSNFGNDFIIFSRSFKNEDIDRLLNKCIDMGVIEFDPWDDADALNLYAWNFQLCFDYVESKELELDRAKTICERSIQLDKKHEVLDTFSRLLLLCNDKQKAKEVIQVAIGMAEDLGDDTMDYRSLLDEISK